MATYRSIASTETDPQAPLTSSLMKALDGNATAIAEGAADAPYVEGAWHPYDSVAVGDGGTGEIWSLAADGAVSTITPPDFEDGYDYAFLFVDVSRGGGSGSGGVMFDAFGATSGAYIGRQLMFTLANGAEVKSALVEALLPRHAGSRYKPIGGLQYDMGSAQKVTRYRLTGTTDGTDTTNLDAGAIYMYRRRAWL